MQDNSALDALEEERSRLLIVDDSELNRALLANIFQQSYEIQEAENGREGLALILSEQDTLSAVLLDVAVSYTHLSNLCIPLKNSTILR